MPTASPPGPQTVPPPWWAKPGRAPRGQERQLQEWRLDRRGNRGAEVAPLSGARLCQEEERLMVKKKDASLTTGTVPRNPPVRVKLRRVNASLSKTYPPDGQGKIWWAR